METFRNAGVPPKQKITTFKISDDALIKPGELRSVPQEDATAGNTSFTPVCAVVFQALLCTPLISALAST